MTDRYPGFQTRMAPLLGAFLLLGIAAPPAFAIYRLGPAPDLDALSRSVMAEAAGNDDAAVAWAESLVACAPASSFARSRLALLHEAAGQDLAALEWGEQALALDSLNVEAAMLVGRMRLRAGESDAAAQVLTPPLRQLGAVPELYALRALAHELSRRYEAALADLKRTGQLLPDFAWIATGILSLALEDDRFEEALSALELALELRPGDARVMTLGTTLARRVGDANLEEALLRELALRSQARPSDVASYAAFLGRVGKEEELEGLLRWAQARGATKSAILLQAAHELLKEGWYGAAIGIVRPVRKAPSALPILARANLAMGQERRALRAYRRLLPAQSVSREESLAVAYLEIRVGDRARGIRLLESARIRPLDSARQVLAASLCYSLLGAPEEVIALLREGTDRGIASPAIYSELADAALVLGDSLMAHWAWQCLRDLGRETPEALYFLASADLSQGRVEQAVTSLSRAIEMNPRHGRALLLLGTLREQNGQLEMARDLLRQAARCPEAAVAANRALAIVCRKLRLDSEAREAENRARTGRPLSIPGLSLIQER